MFVEQVVAPDVPVVPQGRLLPALWRDRLRPWRPLVTLVQQRVATRIWSAIAIPGLAALLVIGLLDVKLIQDERSIAGMRHGIELAVAVHDLAHQLQAERGLAVLAGDAEAAGWRSQQTVSDGAGQRLTTRLADIPGALIAALGGPDQGVTAELATLDALRSRITGGGVGTATIIGGYSKIIENLIRLQESMQGLAVESEVGRAMAGLVALERAREAGEREAVTGSGVIAAGSVSPAARKRLMELAVEQQVRLSGFADGATPAQRVDFDAIEDSPANIELRRFRAVMTADAVAAETVAGWRAASRARLALVEAVADQVIARLRRGADQTKRAADLTLALYGGITLLATGLATILVVALARSITRPINHLTDTMRQLTAGQTDISVPVTRRADGIGELGRSVQLFKDSLVRSAQMADEQQRAQQQRVARAERIDGLTLSFDQLSAQAIGAIAGAAQGLKASAETLTATASDASEQAEAVAGAAGQASINVQTVATATEQLAASIHEIARQVTQSSMMARAAVQEADRSDRIVAGLATAAQQIGDVIGLIQTVARRTNMLALNATIEAVRAGESGRGFAVVASEVKSLANQTARASAEIAAQIAAVQRSTVEAVEVIGSIKDTINDIESVTAAIASAVEQQGAATSDIAHNVKQAAFGTGAVSGSIGAVSGAVSETGHVAHDVLNSGTELTRHCETLRAAVAQFLQAVNQS